MIEEKKNIVWWTGIVNPEHKEKYGNFKYFEYSKKSWKFWCKRNNCEFVEFSQPVDKNLMEVRPNWQKALFVFDELDRRKIKYDQICLVDSSSIVKWNTPNFFELTNHKFSAVRDTDNLNWVHESIEGYREFFNYELDSSKYINSGFMVFNERHKDVFLSFKELFYNNKKTFCNLQENIVKKGTEQTPINYWLQINNVEINFLPLPFKLTHLHRKEMLGYNWQLNNSTFPFFIEYGYIWFFNGIPKDQRSRLMKQTWDLIKDNYDDRFTNVEAILDEVQHKDTAKYTTSRKFKKDIIDNFYNSSFSNKTVLELGTSQGQSTRMLSHLFRHVYTVEWNDWNIEQAKERCKDRDNITFLKIDLYGTDWEVPLADVVFIDAGHEYQQVRMDIDKVLSSLENPVLIFDDFGLPPGEVRQAIIEKIEEGKLNLNFYIGEHPDKLVHAGGTKFIDYEGCICNLG